MKIQSGIIALALLLAALLMAGCATTEDRQAQADRDALCAVLDTDKDGRITKEEFMAKTSDKAKGLEVYEKCDTGKKGYLTYDEFWSQRMMLPPELIITTPPLVQPVRPVQPVR
jgi:Ca2+-binding EF-hand superfamily protein